MIVTYLQAKCDGCDRPAICDEHPHPQTTFNQVRRHAADCLNWVSKRRGDHHVIDYCPLCAAKEARRAGLSTRRGGVVGGRGPRIDIRAAQEQANRDRARLDKTNANFGQNADDGIDTSMSSGRTGGGDDPHPPPCPRSDSNVPPPGGAGATPAPPSPGDHAVPAVRPDPDSSQATPHRRAPKCGTCWGHGLWPDRTAPMGPIDASDGMPTVACPECGAGG